MTLCTAAALWTMLHVAILASGILGLPWLETWTWIILRASAAAFDCDVLPRVCGPVERPRWSADAESCACTVPPKLAQQRRRTCPTGASQSKTSPTQEEALHNPSVVRRSALATSRVISGGKTLTWVCRGAEQKQQPKRLQISHKWNAIQGALHLRSNSILACPRPSYLSDGET